MENKFIKIKSDKLDVEINPLGAEIKSVKGACGTEFIWEADPAVWGGSAPILFPICGGLKEDRYTLSGKEYPLPKHGFLRKSLFEVENQTENSVTFLFKSNDETFKVYPFNFEFRAIFKVKGEKLFINYFVKNLSDKTMYFSTGAHEAYACPEGIENYTVFFETPENLDAYVLDGNILTDRYERIAEDAASLPLKEDYFKVDALVFKTIKSRCLTLEKNNSTKKIKVEFPDFCYLLLWNKYKSKYMCIEPWCGIPDVSGSNFELSEKEGILSLSAESEKEIKHIITFTE